MKTIIPALTAALMAAIRAHVIPCDAGRASPGASEHTSGQLHSEGCGRQCTPRRPRPSRPLDDRQHHLSSEQEVEVHQIFVQTAQPVDVEVSLSVYTVVH